MANLGALTSTSNKGKNTIEKQAEVLSQEFNGVPTMIGDMNMVREPKYHVYVYNVGPHSQFVTTNWGSVSQYGKGFHVPACPKGEPYVIALKVDDVLQEKVGLQGSNEFTFRGRDARFYVQDALNPDDPQGSWKTVRPQSPNTTNMGTNLYNWGYFWAIENPPTKEQLEAARKRMEAHFNSLIEEANALNVSRRDNEIGKTHRMAAEYFGISSAWHMVHTASISCPGCGQAIPPETIVHSCGFVRDWERAIRGGMRTREQYEASLE